MTQPRISRADICAVVVTYFPAPDCAQNLEALAPQVGEILVFDNASSEASFQAISRSISTLNIRVIRNRENLGIAAALNAALAFAREREYKWLATFDQDSLPSADMISRMIELLATYPESERLAVVTPVHMTRHPGISYSGPHCLARGRDWRRLATTMTSGNLVSVPCATAVGEFDAGLFIDYVDNDFCLRLRRHGYHIVEASAAVLWHSLGDTRIHRFLWKRPRTTNHSPLRRYYATRNRVITWKRNWRFDPRWTLWDVRKFLQGCAYIVLWEDRKMDKLGAIARGLLDGMRNVRGKLGATTSTSLQ